jgi:hypothetical protein
LKKLAMKMFLEVMKSTGKSEKVIKAIEEALKAA